MARDQRDRVVVIALVVVVVIALAGGYFFFAKHKRDQAGAAFATAMAVFEAQIAPAPTVPGAKQAPGTFPTARARQEGALAAFQQVAATYGSTQEGLAASYQVASILVSLDRLAEAEKAYQDVIGHAPAGSVYGAMARMGLSETLKEYTDLSGQRDSVIPVDGVLMQLARAYVKAGKPQEARAAFKRVVDEFPESNYVAQARQEMTAISGV